MDIFLNAADEVDIGCCDLFAVCLIQDVIGRSLAQTASDYPLRHDALAGNGLTES